MLLLCYCIAGEDNAARSHQRISEILNLDILDPEVKSGRFWARKRAADYKRNNCEVAKKKRHIAKSVKDQLQQKEDSKKRHRSAKVSVKTSAKTGTETKKKAVLCGKCRRPGHKRNTCPLPPHTGSTSFS